MSAEVRYFGDFELDSSAYRLSRKGETVRLERIPLDLLCLLVERSGQIVTREEILERIWGSGVFIDSENAINTAVRKIRGALDDDAGAPRFVVTIHAKGYRFIAPVLVANGELKISENSEAETNGKPEFPRSANAATESQSERLKPWRVALLSATALALSGCYRRIAPFEAAPACLCVDFG